STPIPGTSPYPSLARVYVGTMRDIPMGITAKISLTSIQQQQENIAGSFNTPENNLFGQIPKSGPFQGTITTSKEIQFTLMGDTGQATFSFDGFIQLDGSIQGTYCSLAMAAGKCSDYGVWNVSPST